MWGLLDKVELTICHNNENYLETTLNCIQNYGEGGKRTDGKNQKEKKIFLGFIRMFQELHQNLMVRTGHKQIRALNSDEHHSPENFPVRPLSWPSTVAFTL